MSEPKQLTTEYASFEALENLSLQVAHLDEMVGNLSDRIHTSVDERLQEMEGRIIDKIDEIQTDIRTELSDKIKFEHEERVQAIDEVSQQFRTFKSDTDAVLKDVSKKIAAVNDTVNRFDGTISNWNRVVDQANDNFKQTKKALEETDSRLDEVTAKQGQLDAGQRQIYKTIYGDSSEDGPDSLFKAISNLGTDMAKEFRAANLQLVTVLNLARDNRNSIETIERERLADKERWTKRWAAAQGYAQQAVGSRYFWITIIVSVIGLFVTINPSTQEFFTNLAQEVFSFLSGQ